MDEQRAKRLEQLLEEFDRLGVGRQVGFERQHLYSIITHSTAIEGSTVTLEENTVMFDEGILPSGRQVQEQLMNLDLKRAYEAASELAAARTVLTLPLLKALSALVMRNTGALYHTVHGEYDESKGDLRLQNVSAGRGGRSYLSWQKVEPRTVEFLTWLNERLARIDELSPSAVYDLSFEAHFRLVTIHPWSDGNGRVARLLMNLVQMEGGVVPSIVRSNRKVDYINALREGQDAGTSEQFLAFMADEVLDVLASEIDEYKRDLDRDVPWAEDETSDVASESVSHVTPQVTHVTPQVTPQVTHVTPQVRSLVMVLGREELGASELRERLGLSDAKSFRLLYLRRAMDAGLVQMTLPDKPRSRNQRYRLTQEGLVLWSAASHLS